MQHRIPEEELRALCARFEGRFGIYVSVPQQNQRFSIGENELVYAASTIKVPILALLYKDAEEGRLDLYKKIPIAPENRVGGSGILRSLAPDIELSLFDLSVLMIVLSDNIATNQIIDAIGMKRLRSFCLANGFENTWLWRKMITAAVSPDADNPQGTPPNAITAGDLGRMLELAAAGRFVSPEVSRKMINVMAGQRLSRLKTLLPAEPRLDPYAKELELPKEGHVVFAGKSGTHQAFGAAHDAGIFYLPDGSYYVAAVCTAENSDESATAIISQIGLTLYNAMK